jgi:1-acyl-sn-glycerol-3-phosphate acyltransferase
VQHSLSPEVVADLNGAGAIQHSLSPEVVEVQSATRHRSLVVEITEESGPQPPMSEREISPVPRSSRPVLALGVARDVFTGGLRPIAGAARGIFSAARTALGISGAAELDMWGKDLSLARSLEPLSDFLYERYFRVTVDGADLVPSGAVILVANHSGALPLDGAMLHLALRRERADLPEARWLMEDQVFHAPFVGVLANRLGAVRANPENATRLLEEQRPVAVFPEGIQGISKRFGERYQLKRFGRGGYVKLAIRLNVPIVPVAIVGAEESMPLLARLPGRLLGLPYLPITVPPLPAKWHIRFGAPFDFSDAPDNADENLAWVAQTNDRTRDAIEGMLTSMLRTRTSVF